MEVHHIIPKCLGGNNKKSNLVVLTSKEHFICHHLLIKIYPEHLGIKTAFTIMLNRSPKKNCKSYEKFRKDFALSCKGKIISEETRQKLSIKINSIKNEDWYKKKISQAVKYAYETTDLRQKMSAAMHKRYENQEARDKISRASKKVWSNPEKRKQVSETTKRQNKENPELKEKRINAIKPHQMVKSDAWKKKCGVWSKEYMNRPEIKAEYSKRSVGENNPMARKVIDITTNKVYNTAIEAAKDLDINISTLKKWLYLKVPKHNCYWLDDFEQIQKEEKC